MESNIEDLITAFNESGDNVLDIGNCDLNVLPEEIFNLNNIETLVLGNGYRNDQTGEWQKSKNLGMGNRIQELTIDLSKLTKLKAIFVCGVGIKNLTFIGESQQLTILDISNNRDLSDLGFLRFVTSVKFLDLSYNTINSFEPVKLLKGLNTLILNHCYGIEDFSMLDSFTQLKDLDVSAIKIEELHPISNLSQLEKLYLNSNNIKDLTPLKGCSKLNTLFLAMNGLKEISPLSELKNLKRLSLGYNLNIRDYSPLSKLVNLEELLLGYNNIKDLEFIKPLTKLKVT